MEAKEGFRKVGGVHALIKLVMTLNEIESIKIDYRTYQNGGRGSLGRVFNNFLNNELGKFLKENNVYFVAKRNTNGHNYPVVESDSSDYEDSLVKITSIRSATIPSDSIQLQRIDDGDYAVHTMGQGRERFIISYLTSETVPITGNEIHANECFIVIKNKINKYNIYDLKKSLNDIEKEIGTKEKEVEELKKKKSSVKWIIKYMDSNKVDEELKETVKTKMIVEKINEVTDPSLLETEINEIVAIDV